MGRAAIFLYLFARPAVDEAYRPALMVFMTWSSPIAWLPLFSDPQQLAGCLHPGDDGYSGGCLFSMNFYRYADWILTVHCNGGIGRGLEIGGEKRAKSLLNAAVGDFAAAFDDRLRLSREVISARKLDDARDLGFLSSIPVLLHLYVLWVGV